MRFSFLCLLLALSACSRSNPNPLTQSDWTKGLQPCSANRMSFQDDQVAYYPKGSLPLVMFRIVSMRQDTHDPLLTDVVVKPTQPVIKRAEQAGMTVPSDYRQMLIFRVEDEKLSLVARAHADGSNRVVPNAVARADMNLVRCPK